MTTAEALAVVREALEGEWFSEEVDAALALIGGRLEELEAFRLRGNARRLAEAEAERDELLEQARGDYRVINGMKIAAAEYEQRIAELEAALREIVDFGDLEGWGFVEDIARRALGGGE